MLPKLVFFFTPPFFSCHGQNVIWFNSCVGQQLFPSNHFGVPQIRSKFQTVYFSTT